MALGELLDANALQRIQLECTRTPFLSLQLTRVVSNGRCLQAIIAVANVLTSLVSAFAALVRWARLLGLTLMCAQFANNARVGSAPCYPDNVAFPELFMKSLKQFKGQGAGVPIQCVLRRVCLDPHSAFTIVCRVCRFDAAGDPIMPFSVANLILHQANRRVPARASFIEVGTWDLTTAFQPSDAAFQWPGASISLRVTCAFWLRDVC